MKIFSCGLILLGILAACLAYADGWSISAQRDASFAGTPVRGVGVRIPGTSSAVQEAVRAGFSNICVDLPAGGANWRDVIRTLEGAHVAYSIRIDSLAPEATGYAVDPIGYRLPHASGTKTITVTIPGVQSALAVLAITRDGTVEQSQVVQANNDVLSIPIDADGDFDQTLLIYPKMKSFENPDYWAGMDAQRDTLLHSLAIYGPMKGLRAIIDPDGQLAHAPKPDAHFVPTTPFFQYELAAYLRNKYRNIETAMKTWRMQSNSITTFTELSTLVPLWVDDKGLPKLWEPKTNEFYPVDDRNGPVWEDFQAVLNGACAERFKNLTNSIHKLVSVPVVEDWAGWGLPYEGIHAVDGVGIVADAGDQVAFWKEATSAASSAFRSPQPSWLIATSVDLPKTQALQSASDAVRRLVSIGARLIYFHTDHPAQHKALIQLADGVTWPDAGTLASNALYFPVNSSNPVFSVELPGGVWWLPSPLSGNRVDYGSQIQGYSINLPSGVRYVLWNPGGPLQTKLLTSNPHGITISNADGSVVPVKDEKGGIPVTLSQSPIIVAGDSAPPVPVQSIDELSNRFAQLMVIGNNLHADVMVTAIQFKRFSSSLNFTPGSSYDAMLGQFNSLKRKLAPFTWIEGENFDSADLGSIVSIPGCSGNHALSIESKLEIPGALYTTTYSVSAKNTDTLDAWIACRASQDTLRTLQVVIGSQALILNPTPVSYYGDGFAWYHLGLTRLPPDQSTLRVVVNGSNGCNLDIDAIVLYPNSFSPNGVRIPWFIQDAPSPVKPKAKRG